MADDKSADETQASGGKKKLILIIIVAVLVAALGAGAAVYFLVGGGSNEASTEAQAPAEPVKKEALYTKVRTMEGKPSFVVTLQSRDGKRHYMQAFIEAKSRNQEVVDALTLHMPLVVARLNQQFAGYYFEDLKTVEGKEQMRKEATELVQELLQEKIGKPGIETILFTNFVMQ